MSGEQREEVAETEVGEETAIADPPQPLEDQAQDEVATVEQGDSIEQTEEVGKEGEDVEVEQLEEVTGEEVGRGDGEGEGGTEVEGGEGEGGTEVEGGEGKGDKREEGTSDEIAATAGEGEGEEEQRQEESMAITEELVGDGEEQTSGAGENVEGGGESEAGDNRESERRDGEGGESVDGESMEKEGERVKGEGSGEEEGTEREVRGEDTQEEREMKHEVEGEVVGVAMMSPSGSRLVSASKVLPLENIIEEGEEMLEEEEEEEVVVDRGELIKSCREALKHKRDLREENAKLQHKIAEYLSQKKVEERPDPGRNVTDQEKRYHQCMSALDHLEMDLQHVKTDWMEKEEEMRALCEVKQREVEEEEEGFLDYQQDGAKDAVDSRNGRKMTKEELKRLKSVQKTKDQAVFQARLENIKLTNKIERLETLLKQKEELAEGLHMIDFEQLKISNVDLGEKVEERNEDITKLTGKVRATVQVLTHVKEKLHFMQGENEKKREHLELLDSDLAKRRDVLTRLKQARDSLRLDNQRLRQRGGLVCHTELLRDFEDRQDQNAELQSKLEKLQCQHSQSSLQCAGLRGKIEHARSLQHRLH